MIRPVRYDDKLAVIVRGAVGIVTASYRHLDTRYGAAVLDDHGRILYGGLFGVVRLNPEQRYMQGLEANGI